MKARIPLQDQQNLVKFKESENVLQKALVHNMRSLYVLNSL